MKKLKNTRWLTIYVIGCLLVSTLTAPVYASNLQQQSKFASTGVISYNSIIPVGAYRNDSEPLTIDTATDLLIGKTANTRPMNRYVDSTPLFNNNDIGFNIKEAWFEYGDLYVEMFVTNGRDRTIYNIDVNSIRISNTSGIIAEDSFGRMHGATIAPNSFIVWSFVFPNTSVMLENANISWLETQWSSRYDCGDLPQTEEGIHGNLRYRDDGSNVTIIGYIGEPTSVLIPGRINGNPVTAIDHIAFLDCTSLTSIVIPSGVTHIGNMAFSGCTSLTSIVIPYGVTTISVGTFLYCTSLTSIEIPNSVTFIAWSAFSDCTSLTSITIPSSVTHIGDSAFMNCTSLTSIAIPNSITYIESHTFWNCTSLTSITIPSSVRSIRNSAFRDCNNLYDVVFESTTPPTTSANAFNGVKSGARAIVPNGATAYGQTGSIWNGLTVFNPTQATAHVPVTSITGVPTAATAGVPLTLTGSVNPSNATNRTISWSVLNASETGATISGHTLNTTAAGTVTVRATIIGGRTSNTSYTQDFTITISATSTASQATGVAPNLSSASAWAHTAINEAHAMGLVPIALRSSYTQAMTRAEFCALAVALYENLRGEITGRRTFSDTNDINVQKAAAIGVVGGIGNNRFAPHSQLTREQAATMLARLANAIGSPLPLRAATFSDNSAIASWALSAVGQVQATGIMSGTGSNRFSPKGAYTREQSIATILRTCNVISASASATVQTPTPAPIPNLAPAINVSEFERRVFELTNAERAKHGLQPLIWDEALARASRLHSEDLARNNLDGHIGSDGSSRGERARREGWKNIDVAENCTYGRNTPEDAVESWMNSPPHRANILDSRTTHIGVGFAQLDGSQYRYYTTQKFSYEQSYIISVLKMGSLNVGGIDADVSYSVAKEGEHVNLNAGTLPGHVFVRWEVLSGNITISNPNSPSISFFMPDRQVSLIAFFRRA